MILHSWILECLELFGAAQNVKTLLENSMNGWQTELTSDGESLGSVSIRRGIFQGDSLSPPPFVVSMIPVSNSQKVQSGIDIYKQDKGQSPSPYG